MNGLWIEWWVFRFDNDVVGWYALLNLCSIKWQLLYLEIYHLICLLNYSTRTRWNHNLKKTNISGFLWGKRGFICFGSKYKVLLFSEWIILEEGLTILRKAFSHFEGYCLEFTSSLGCKRRAVIWDAMSDWSCYISLHSPVYKLSFRYRKQVSRLVLNLMIEKVNSTCYRRRQEKIQSYKLKW